MEPSSVQLEVFVLGVSGVGMNVPAALRPLEASDDQPYAVLTKLGWTIHGPVASGSIEHSKSNRIKIGTTDIEQMVKLSFNDFQDTTAGQLPGPSIEEQDWEDKVRRGTRYENEHYLIDLPFREGHPKLPNNLMQAIQRCQSLRRRLSKDEPFAAENRRVMDELLVKKFSEPVEDRHRAEEGEYFYIPHHGLIDPRKPNKLRVVFDCTSQFNEMS